MKDCMGYNQDDVQPKRSVSIRQNVIWMALAQGFVFAVGFTGSIVIARLLSPREMGVYAIAAATAGVLAVLRGMGLNNLLIRESVLTAPIVATAFTVNLALAIASSIIISISSLLEATVFESSEVAIVLRVLALTPLLSAFEFLPAAYLERNGEFARMSLINLARAAVNTVVTLELAYSGYSYTSIAWGNVAGACFSAFVMSLQWLPFPRFNLSLREWRRVLAFGTQMISLTIVGSISDRLLDVILGRVAGLAALGVYSRASSLNNMLWDNMHVLIGRLVFVHFSKTIRQGLSLRDSYLRFYAMITALLWPAFLGISIISGPIILNIYGAKWLDASIPVSLLAIASVIYTSTTMTWELYVVCGQGKAQLRFQIRKTCTGMTLFTVGCFGGIIGAAVSRIFDALFITLFVRGDIERMTDTKASDHVQLVKQSLWLSLLGCGPTLIYMLKMSWSPYAEPGHLLIFIFLGLCLWLSGLFVVGHPLLIESRFIARRMLQFVSLKPRTDPLQ